MSSYSFLVTTDNSRPFKSNTAKSVEITPNGDLILKDWDGLVVGTFAKGYWKECTKKYEDEDEEGVE